jgi:hypothetical protein
MVGAVLAAVSGLLVPQSHVYELATYPLATGGYSGSGTSIRPIDPETLRPLRRHGLRVGDATYGPVDAPDGRRIVLGAEVRGDATVVDMRRSRIERRIHVAPTGYGVYPVGWPTAHLLVLHVFLDEGKYGWLRNSLALVDPEAACGRIALVADAHDTQAIPVRGSFADFPVSPALLTWSMARRDDARPIAAATGRDDFRGTLPPSRDFWHVYARGTYQNRPVFGRRLYSMPGVFLFQLTRDGLDTRTLPNGLYTVTVRAQDIDGNFGSLTRELRIENDAATPTGCRAPAPLPPSPLPPQPPLRP